MHDYEYLRRMLVLIARTETREEMDWALNVGEDGVTFTVPVSGMFDPDGGLDAVPVRPSDVDDFAQALRDVEDATDGDATFGPLLYACRARGARPCNQAWPADSRVHPLFEAAVRSRDGEPMVVATMTTSGVAVPETHHMVLSAGGDWPALMVTPADKLLDGHDCAPSAHGGPDHCGLCGRLYGAQERV